MPLGEAMVPQPIIPHIQELADGKQERKYTWPLDDFQVDFGVDANHVMSSSQSGLSRDDSRLPVANGLQDGNGMPRDGFPFEFGVNADHVLSLSQVRQNRDDVLLPLDGFPVEFRMNANHVVPQSQFRLGRDGLRLPVSLPVMNSGKNAISRHQETLMSLNPETKSSANQFMGSSNSNGVLNPAESFGNAYASVQSSMLVIHRCHHENCAYR